MAEEQAPTSQMLPVYPVDNDDLVHKIGMRGEIRDRLYLGGRHVEQFGKQVRGRLGLIFSGQIMMDTIKRQVGADRPSDCISKARRSRHSGCYTDDALAIGDRLYNLAHESRWSGQTPPQIQALHHATPCATALRGPTDSSRPSDGPARHLG